MRNALPSLSRVGRSHPLCRPTCSGEIQVLKRLLTNLDYLCLANTHIEGPGSSHLTELAVLRHLVLHHTPVTAAGLTHLKQLPRLRTLSRCNTETADAGPEHLQGSGYEELDLPETRVTKQGISNLLESVQPGRGTIRHSPFAHSE